MIYISFRMKFDAFFTLEILEFLRGCTGFCSAAVCDFIVQGYLPAGTESLCAGICMASSKGFLIH